MGIDVPNLDDREFEEIFEKARRQIPVHTDDWTNHNASDTGIAILEVLAWISETYTYQINQISDEDREKYLKLLGVSRKPPSAASARLRVSVPDDADGATIPAGEKLLVNDRSGVTKTFETEIATTLIDADIDRVVTNAGNDTVNNTTENDTENTHYYAFGESPQTGDVLYLGFDGDPFSNSTTLELTVDLYNDKLPTVASHGDFESTFEPSVNVSWEYCEDYANWDEDEAWVDIPVDRDGTDSFYHDGRVTLTKPAGWSVDWPAVESTELHNQPSGTVWIRFRVERPGYEVPPQLSSIQLNVLPVRHGQRIVNVPLERDDEAEQTGIEAGQTFVLDKEPVLDATITVAGEEWTEVDDLDQSGPQDKHYELDRQNGEIVFGNGIDGAKLPVGETVFATEYVHGGGTEGNISGAAEWSFKRDDAWLGNTLLPDVEVEPLGPATGGTDMESISDALDRFKRDLKVPYRGVTLDDYSYVAAHTPGLRFGRANATAETTKTETGAERREIHVVVVPYSNQDRPEPSDGFVQAVENHLDRCRLMTDTVRVQKPKYVTCRVQLTVVGLPGYSDAAVKQEIRTKLDEYFHPISGYGGDGWPFGRPLYASEIEDVVDALSAVKSVKAASVTASGPQQTNDRGNIIIDEMSLPSISTEDIAVTVEDATSRREER